MGIREAEGRLNSKKSFRHMPKAEGRSNKLRIEKIKVKI